LLYLVKKNNRKLSLSLIFLRFPFYGWGGQAGNPILFT